jgi:hypothetical protein
MTELIDSTRVETVPTNTNDPLAKIAGRSKEYEMLTINFDPLFNDLLIGINVVKEFIIEHGLILYGGSAINYALLLRGDRIYPEGAIDNDLDFYSPTNIKHAYMLADKLFAKGFKDARAILGEHAQVMRVDLGSNHFIADISHKPPGVFATLPYLVYNEMKIIHPLYQRVDVHAALSFPYDGPPREVIFARSAKDITRFNKLDQYYPVEPITKNPRVQVSKTPTMGSITVPMRLRKYIFTGFAAYAFLYTEYASNVPISARSPHVLPASLDVSAETISFSSPISIVEIVNFNIRKAAQECNLQDIREYDAYVNLSPERITGTYAGTGSIRSLSILPGAVGVRVPLEDGGIPMTIYSTHNRLIAANSIHVTANGDSASDSMTSFRIVNVQPLLGYFLSGYFIHEAKDPRTAMMYMDYYKSIINMIVSAEGAGSQNPSAIIKSALFPTVHTYGSENINLAREIQLNRLYSELDKVARYQVPRNYYPAKKAEHPAIMEHTLFREEGGLRGSTSGLRPSDDGGAGSIRSPSPQDEKGEPETIEPSPIITV